jgi:hypothetical protein
MTHPTHTTNMDCRFIIRDDDDDNPEGQFARHCLFNQIPWPWTFNLAFVEGVSQEEFLLIQQSQCQTQRDKSNERYIHFGTVLVFGDEGQVLAREAMSTLWS